MPTQTQATTENNFTRGLITEATGLNFPENAATSASNCIFTLIGDVTRREGINNEVNGTTTVINRTLSAMSTFTWHNPGGDGNSKLLVEQVGNTLYFYNIAAATNANPLSTQILATTVTVSNFTATGGTFDATQECTYASGNGYLFVYHGSCDPFYVSYNPNTLTVTAVAILVKVRDFSGLPDGLDASTRPTSLSAEHNYNLANQGWATVPPWVVSLAGIEQATGNSIHVGGTVTFTAPSTLGGVANGQVVTFTGFSTKTSGIQVGVGSGTVQAYIGTHLTLFINSYSGNPTALSAFWNLAPTSSGFITTWFSAEQNYPSNSDIWWLFKDTTGVFNPTSTAANQSFSLGLAPRGHYITSAWNIDRTIASAISGLTPVSTLSRPTKGAWFQGRLWFTGLNASQQATGDANYYTWTENVYYSQTIEDPSQFGNCYQTNDPTAQDLNGELPTDGGILVVVNSGTIHKLWPIMNGLLIFANNGVWFVTGSQGIGFASNDYTITQISNIKIQSSTSFVDFLGLPLFWNEEGIYQVKPSQNGSLTVDSITVGSILTYYAGIPIASKKYVRGDYDPINYTAQWCFRSTQESSVTDRYQFDTILCYNTFTKAFYTYTLSVKDTNFIHDIKYISTPFVNVLTPIPGFKYPCSNFTTVYNFGIADEHDTNFVDWGSANFISNFTTGYKVHGSGWRKFTAPYVYIYSRNNGYAAYYIQGAWDYGSNFDSNRWSVPQFTELNDSNSSTIERRHKIRGKGYALQLMVTSVTGQPFDIIGWALYENVNVGV